ncbi:hypothetical protein [Paludisphaera soli]|uniref:hypothetical protein n=1 Tax=Paludisphaera soli TaxID=2712865 RepID=UPI0013EA80F6|nr:hypothetical protein [Paludisphaera soli]
MIRPEQRLIMQTPLTELWDARGTLPIKERRDVGCEQVRQLLRDGPVRFVIADCGRTIRWIALEDSFRFWKEEVKSHLIDWSVHVRGTRLEDWPGEYFYSGSEWDEVDGAAVVLLVKHH